MIFITNSKEETISLAEKFGKLLKGGEAILLEGELGAGKTQFTKGLALALGISEEVTSPTFTIERIYEGKGLNLHHFDFYRLSFEDPEIIEEIKDLLSDKQNVVVIEWPSNIKGIKPEKFFEIEIRYLDDKSREFKFLANNDEYSKYFEEM